MSLRVEFELSTCGCTKGGIGSIRVYRSGREVRKEIISSLKDAAQVVEFCPGDRYLIKIRTRLSDAEFADFIGWLRLRGARISIKEDGWGVGRLLGIEAE